MPTATDMKFKREDLNPCTIKYEVTCSPDQVKTGFDRAYKGFAKQMRIPGFRPGHAPKQVVQKYVQPADVNGAAAEEIVRASMNELLKTEKVQPHDSPSVSLTSIDEAKGECTYTVKVPLKPVVELGDYKTLTANRPPIEVTDEEVDHQLEEIRKRSSRRESIVDRGATDGDVVVVNLREDGKDGEGRNFMSVVGQTFGELDKALTGMRAEEMKIVTLNFPADFQEKEFAGKKVKTLINLKSVSSISTPELDDEFAKSLDKDLKSLKSDTLKDLRDKMRERLTVTKQQIAQEYVNEALQAELLNRSKVEVPDTMWESVANQRLNELNEEAQRNKKTIEEYAKENGMTVEDMVAKWQVEAKVQVQRAVLAQEIFNLEKMKLSNEDLNQALLQMAYEYQVPPAQLAEIMQRNKNFTELQIRGVFNRVIAFLNSHATITEGDAAPAKKPAAKKAKAEEGAEEAPAKPKKTTKKS